MKQPLLVLLLGLALAGCKSAPDTATAEPPAPVEESEPAEPAQTTATPAPAIVVNDTSAERRVAPNGKAEILLFATGDNAFLGKLSMEAGGQVPVHRDATEEYVYILEGEGVITIDGKDHEVGPNTAIYMPANAEVTYKNGSAKLVALQVFAGPGPAAKYEKWEKK